MRIIGGEARGRFLRTLKNGDLSVRPILARIKKSLFDILSPRIPDAAFLDLFAGTGAVGLEALSRGAAMVVFVDASRRSLDIVKENIKMLGWSGRAETHYADVLKGLGWLNRSFDLIFLGPPYKDENKKPLALTTPSLQKIVDAEILRSGGLIIAQHHVKEPVAAPPGFEIFRQEQYGDTLVSFCRKKASC